MRSVLLRDVLRPNRPHHHKGCRAAFHRLARLFANAFECVQSALLHLGRDDFYFDARQLLWKNLASGGLAPLMLFDCLRLGIRRRLLADQH